VDEDVPDGQGEPTDQVLVLSARSAASLVALKAKFRAWLADQPDGDWPSICFTAAVGRAHLPHRVAVVASSPGEAVTALDADTGHSGLLESGSAPRLATTSTRSSVEPSTPASRSPALAQRRRFATRSSRMCQTRGRPSRATRRSSQSK
jgi:hypothetical protein